MASIVLAAIYFGSVWLGRRVKCSVIFRSVIDMSQRMGQLGGFLYYALASGLKRVFARGGGWKGLMPEESEVEDRQMLLNLDLTG